MKVAILCAARKTVYRTMPDLDIYDIDRDVRTFAGGMPIVAHPPCRSWSAYFAHQAKPLPGEKELGPLCVDWLRKCGGVLEHPAHSRLWDHCGLPLPGERERDGVWSLAIDQAWFGDSRRKRTWLLFSHVEPMTYPLILRESKGDREAWNKLSKGRRSETKPAFADWLVAVARSAKTADSP